MQKNLQVLKLRSSKPIGFVDCGTFRFQFK